MPAQRSPEPRPFRVPEHGLPFDAPSRAEPLPGEIRSAAIRSLTSPNLIRLKTLVNAAADRRQSLQGTISSRRFSVDVAERRLAFAKTFIVRLFSRGRIACLVEEIETGRLEIEAATKELELTSIQLDFDFDEHVLRLFNELREAFDRLRRSARVWDVTTENATNQFAERTLAFRAVTRTLVTFGTARTDIVKADWEALRFGNANGEDLHLYPGFALLKERSGDFALVDIADLRIQAGAVRFHEEDGVPHDATVVGTTWKKTNKDGSPDRRFRDNYQIPIAHYGELTIRSKTGINEAYMFSNAGAAASFASAFATYQAALAAAAGGVAAPFDDGADGGAVETAFEVDADGDAPDRRPPFPVLDAVFLALLAVGADGLRDVRDVPRGPAAGLDGCKHPKRADGERRGRARAQGSGPRDDRSTRPSRERPEGRGRQRAGPPDRAQGRAVRRVLPEGRLVGSRRQAASGVDPPQLG
nr:hypothetical protein [Azospirillum argentinense]